MALLPSLFTPTPELVVLPQDLLEHFSTGHLKVAIRFINFNVYSGTEFVMGVSFRAG